MVIEPVILSEKIINNAILNNSQSANLVPTNKFYKPLTPAIDKTRSSILRQKKNGSFAEPINAQFDLQRSQSFNLMNGHVSEASSKARNFEKTKGDLENTPIHKITN